MSYRLRDHLHGTVFANRDDLGASDARLSAADFARDIERRTRVFWQMCYNCGFSRLALAGLQMTVFVSPSPVVVARWIAVDLLAMASNSLCWLSRKDRSVLSFS